MKRVRITPSPPRNLRRPAAPAAAPSGTYEPWELRVADALDCMLSVRRTLDQAKYHDFLHALSLVHSIGQRGVVDRVKVLLRGHPDLKRQFNLFLPAEYRLSLSDDDDQQ